MSSKPEWARISLPRPVAQFVTTLARRLDVPAHRVVHELVDLTVARLPAKTRRKFEAAYRRLRDTSRPN
jgi:hypothetical protein